MPIQFKLDVFEDRNMAVLHVIGDLDFDVRSLFQTELDELLQTSATRLVLDLSPISRMSSVFIGTIVDYATRAQQEKKHFSCMLQDKMVRVCTEAGMGKVLQIIPVKV